MSLVKWAYKQTIRYVSYVQYGVYYAGYKMNRYAARNQWAEPVRPVGWVMQA